MKQFPIPRSRRFFLALGVVALVAIATALFMNSRRQNPLLAAPTLALQEVSGKSLYYNSAARDWLLSKRADLLTPEDRDNNSARTRGLIQAVQNPKLFRQLDRQYRFDTLLLVGDPSQYRPLLDHLLETKDWALSYLDHTSLIFRREGDRPWSKEEFAKVRTSFEKASASDRATFLAQAANKLIAVRQTTLAKELLEEARGLDEGLAEVWSTQAQYRMAMGQWNDAIADADRALAIDEDWTPAIAAKTQALYSSKHFSDAYPYSRQLIEKHPDDPSLLFYHAKIAHEARAYTDEIRTLTHLIELAEKENRPASGYRVYLGQAYASDGQGKESLEEFRKATADPELPKEQRQFAEESSAMIKARIGVR
ncbi:hypothetical protein ACXR0O_20795 [Verrucomicrobiota bacterium sgz303538]